MKVKMMYFASIRESVGISQEVLETKSTNADQLLHEIVEKYNLALSLEHIKIAINEEYVAFNTLLNEGDTVVLIPPVAGG